MVAWGISFGGAAATLATAEDPQIAGLVCDSSFRSLRDTARHHLALFRKFAWWLRLVPAWPTSDIAVFWMGRRAGFDPDDLDIVKGGGEARRPAGALRRGLGRRADAARDRFGSGEGSGAFGEDARDHERQDMATRTAMERRPTRRR